MNEIGTVISSMNGPSPSELNFVVNQGTVHRGQFVEVEYEEGILIALIENVMKTNRYFERAESVKEFEKQDTQLFENFPVKEWEYLIAITKPLGVFRDGISRKTTIPVSPGTKVKIASPEILKKFLRFDEEKGLQLGKLEYNNIEVKLNMTKLFQKHCAILAQSGYGKSVTSSVLIEELLSRKKESGRIAIIVFDLHGEYLSFGEVPKPEEKHKKNFSQFTKIVHSRDIKIGVSKLSAGSFKAFLPDLSGPQKRELNKIISKLQHQMKEGLGPYDLNDIKNEIINSEEMNDKTKNTMISWMYELDELKLFENIDSPSLNDLIKPGSLTVINLSDTIYEKKRQLIVSYFARKMFNDRRNKKIPPFVLVLEEAHNFIPQYTTKHENFCRPIFRTIAREGRKFGACLCLISQRPVQLDTTTLSQCGTNIFMRITNPNDLKHIAESAEAIDKNSLNMITSLRVGEALIVGEAVGYPLFFKVRQKISLDSKHEKTLEESAQEFEQNKTEKELETKEFL